MSARHRDVKKKKRVLKTVAVRTRSAKVYLPAGVEACTGNVQKNIDGLQPGEFISCYGLIFTRCVVRSRAAKSSWTGHRLTSTALYLPNLAVYMYHSHLIALRYLLPCIPQYSQHVTDVSVTLPLALVKPHISSFTVQNYTKPLLNNISNCHYKPSIQMRYMIANVFRYKNT